jgi:hypothetical protein
MILLDANVVSELMRLDPALQVVIASARERAGRHRRSLGPRRSLSW